MVLTYATGFQALHGNGDHDNEEMVNYGDVGFCLILDTRLVPLMDLGVWGSPSLGLGSMKELVILLGLLFVWFQICTVDEEHFQVDRGKALLGFISIVVIP